MEDAAIANDDLGVDEMEQKAHPVYKTMIKRFLPKQQRERLNYWELYRQQHENDEWSGDKYDKEKEGYLPLPNEKDDGDYYDDYYGYNYYYDQNYFRNSRMYNSNLGYWNTYGTGYQGGYNGYNGNGYHGGYGGAPPPPPQG